MPPNATTAEDRLAKLGIHLPDAPKPFGAYVPVVQTGNLLFLSGMLAISGHAASELLRNVFGEETKSSRLVCGVASLPPGSPVELEVILEVKLD